MADLSKPFDPQEHEAALYQRWLDSGFFNPDNLPGERAEPFTIMMPPPNATGILHAGHALFLTLQDLIIRFQRMNGKKALWLPGTDHAAIATQARVEKEIYKKEGKNRYDLGREELLSRIDNFVAEHRSIMVNQMKAMGSSCDWSREAFTLDEARNRAVVEAFRRLYDLGLIVRGQRVINWDPKGQTTISDDEIVYDERSGKLWTFRYAKDFPIPIATTRPETKVGDVAVAVNPDDDRYKQYVGQEFAINFCGVDLNIKVVADAAVDPTFGTGAVGVTPAHSHIDADIAARHKLPMLQVINEHAKMIVGDERLLNKKVAEARAEIVSWLQAEGLLISEEDTTQNIATAERTGGVIEPLPKLQWFIDVDKSFNLPSSALKNFTAGQSVTLKQLMRNVAESGEVTFIPERFTDTYYRWIDNLHNWCISRQIWYGHRVPVWYRGQEIVVGTAPNGEGWEQDPDTLDTWFSAGIWTFSTLGWPDDTEDLRNYHPTDVLETAYEILFFWVARMILMSTALVGEVPFRQVYLHGLVRDEKRQKLSKSKADSADPLDLIAKFGTDALRLALVFGSAPGTDSILSEQKIKGMKHFANKVWNATRFVTMNLEADTKFDGLVPPANLTADDKQVIKELNDFVGEITRLLNEYKFYLAAEQLYHYFWNTFADKIIEAQKPRLKDEQQRAAAQFVLATCLATSLKLLHPFMPFVTEAVWQELPKNNPRLLMIESWPEAIKI
jgi:valyl-tRNA synthetase